MFSTGQMSTESPLLSFTLERSSKMRIRANGPLKNYERATLSNRVSGKREEVVLFDPNDEDNEGLIAVDEHFELAADLKEAFEHFSTLQQRILFRVLVQGQTIEKATARSKKNGRTWRRWLNDEALPKLRDLLSDYRGEMKEVHRDLIPTPSNNDDVSLNTVKCKFCDHTETGRGETAFQKLRTHVSKTHRSEFKKIKHYVQENDRDLARLEEDLSFGEGRVQWRSSDE